ncbi:hypothetical protein BZG36_03332 [Bifiguratus adelaidae]|uniref:Dynamin-related protein DNM1 n=1 Tax=Bifiguratus adelaidae TaxID=1938954 RepID=A0A261XXW7_9FUNG|nr:hypothetical protein BZG36_03332 [Bifiguratus adelaidae]
MENFRDLIPLVNKLQDVFSTISSNDTLDLPQIVVVGSQSSGKSSVLENIVQKDFLPRGSGIVTRRPLILQLITLKGEENKDTPEFGEFLHIPNKRFENFSEIRNEIEHETIRVAGTNKGISRNPIHLKVYSPKVLNLTLVDLPGLTKIPVGDQPTDIEKQIRGLVLDYISKPNSIILAVSPANQDLANSDSLKVARQVDPQGRRTLGVLTKLDLMDAGTNALDVLSGRAYPLKLGFIGVVNRSQQDILTNKPMEEALKAESDFFKMHPAYRNVAHRCGTPFLTRQLNNLLMAHIRDRLPDLKARLNSMIGQTQQELSSYGDPAFAGQAHRGTLILQLLTKFANEFVASIDGTSLSISTKELSGGARIYFIFNSVFGSALDAIQPCSNLSNLDIRTAIRNSMGPRSSLFVPEIAFDLLVKPQIQLLETPSLRCVELAYEELMKICHNCGNKELQRFPRLQAKLVEVVSDLLRERLGPTSSYVESLISIQRAYINTNHPDFLGATGAMAQLEHEVNRKKTASRKKISVASPASTIKDVPNGVHRDKDGKVQQINGVVEPEETKDAFLEYFFGGASRSERSALGSSDIMSSSKLQQQMSLNNMFEAELERRFRENLNIGDHEGEPELTDREEMESQLIRSLITSYFNIVRKTIQDLVPKAVMHLLVNYSREAVQNRLVESVYKEDLFDELLSEDDNLIAERAKCQAMLDVYRKAFKIIADVM